MNVAPREIRDVVRRCCQVRQVDAGVADAIGGAVMDAHLQGIPALAQFVDALDTDGIDANFTVRHAPPLGESPENPYRDGVEVDATLWTELHTVAEAFLVSAELLDGFTE